MPRYLVSGAAGFIGSNLVESLLQTGAQVVGVDSLAVGATTNLRGLDLQFIQADVTEARDWPGPWDAVFHQGDITDPRHPDAEQVRLRNKAGFEAMAQVAVKAGARFIYASTAGLYGNGPTPMREDQPKQLQTPYGESKLKMDEAAATLAAAGLQVVGLRYFNVYGPREGHKGRAASMVYHLYHQVKQGKAPRLFEWGEQKRDFVYVKDVVRACTAALGAPSGVYNVGTGVGASFNTLVEALGAAMGRKLKPEYFPMPYDPATYQVNTQADMRLAREKLGFEPQWDLFRGVKDYVQWLDAQGEEAHGG